MDAAVDFEPGQYVTMRIPELGCERCYSISSAPFGTNTFTITVKRVPGGVVSSYLHDSVRVGDRVHVDGPYGLFSTSFHPAQRHLFLSAGSGITPIMSMVRSLLARQGGFGTDIVVRPQRGSRRSTSSSVRNSSSSPSSPGSASPSSAPGTARDGDVDGAPWSDRCGNPRRGRPRRGRA
jgi:hypothetical protein